MNRAWKTKYGLRRVRRDDPTLEEAIFAAKGLTGNLQEQAEIAASLMALPVDQVMPEVIKARAPRKTVSTVAFTQREGSPRAVVVERRTTRRPLTTTTRRFGS